ncbi:hypothetical protein J4E89_000835 [Alternaria sp. Ai002NY15]|nr:hypothetical protein J4E89_000835 [Alternaria sp. Ai002NY15]
MSITFGAVGDIISVALLAKDLIATLDEARGSKAEYRDVVQAINNLNEIIDTVNTYVIQPGLVTPDALLSVNRKEMNEKLDGAQLRNDITTTSQHAALDDIKDGMKTANMNIEAGTSMLTKVSEALKFDWIRQLGCEIKGKMESVMVINFAIYDAITRLQETLPRYLERGISEELITLEDPIGRVAPFSLQWITSWDAFHSALELRFQDMPGQSKMRRRQYALQASEHEEEDITSFKRVRIVSKRKLVGKRGNISPDKALPERFMDPRGLTNDDFEKMFGPLSTDQFHDHVGRRAGEQGPRYAPARLNTVRTVLKNKKERDRIKAKLANETTPPTQRELELWRELNSASAAPHIGQTIHLGNHDQESKR